MAGAKRLTVSEWNPQRDGVGAERPRHQGIVRFLD